MPQEIRLSLIGSTADRIRPFLEQFEKEEAIHVDLTVLSWENAWSHLVKASIYSHDLDVSEIGSTWVGDLIKMDTLRPFSDRDVAAFGGQSAFLSSFWDGGRLGGEDQLMAMPWLTGANLLYYRRSLFKKAGIDPAVAFANVDFFADAMRRLHACGICPLLETNVAHDIMLHIASWVWGKGGEFMSPNGKSTRFAQPEALAGMIAYFELIRFIPQEHQNTPAIEANYRFLDDPNCATFTSGVWLYQWAKDRLLPEEFDDLAIARPPGATFMGGSYLAVWKTSVQVDAVMKLINFMTQTQTAANYGYQLGLLPARVESLSHPVFAEQIWQASIEGLKMGRTFPTVELWGLVQDRLTQELGNIWKEVLAQPNVPVSDIVTPRIKALARRLDMTLSS